MQLYQFLDWNQSFCFVCFVFLWKSPSCLHLEYLFAGTGRWTTPHPEEFQREFSSLTTSISVLFCFFFCFFLSFARKRSKRWTLWEINVTKRSTVASEEYRCLPRPSPSSACFCDTISPASVTWASQIRATCFIFTEMLTSVLLLRNDFSSDQTDQTDVVWRLWRATFSFFSAKVISAVTSAVPDGHVKVVSNTSYWPRQAELANVLVSHSMILHLA